MKRIITIVLVFFCFSVLGQQQKFLIEGKVTDRQGNPITDVYIVNLNGSDKDVSHSNGVFALWVSPTDSLVFLHVSYFREIVKVHTLRINPEVKLEAELVDIPEIRVSPNQITDYQRAKQNMAFLDEYEVQEFTRIKDTSSPLQTIMLENNKLLRSEAASLSLVRFSPSVYLEKLFLKLKNKDRRLDYDSTKKLQPEQ